MVGSNLKAEMARRGLTVREMARMLGITPNTFSTKINGKRPWLLEEAMCIVDILNKDNGNFTVEELFGPQV